MVQTETWKSLQSGRCVIPLQRGLIELSGKDRGTFLQGLFSQDVAKNFPVGSATYGVFTNVKGKIIADAYIFHADENRFLLDVEAFATEKILQHLNQFLILTKAEIKNLSGEYQCRVVPFDGDSSFKLGPVPANAIRFSIQRPQLQETRIWIHPQDIPQLIQTGLQEAPEAIYDTLRIELGIPKLGQEMDETTYPQEVGLEEALDFKKGCFVGAEVLQHIHYRGRVNRSLALFSTEELELIPTGTPILQNDTEVGKITSNTLSSQWNKHIALGLVKNSALDSGAPFTASIEEKPTSLQLLKTFQPTKK